MESDNDEVNILHINTWNLYPDFEYPILLEEYSKLKLRLEEIKKDLVFSYTIKIIFYLKSQPNTTYDQLHDRFKQISQNEENDKIFLSAWKSLLTTKKVSFDYKTQIVTVI